MIKKDDAAKAVSINIRVKLGIQLSPVLLKERLLPKMGVVNQSSANPLYRT